MIADDMREELKTLDDDGLKYIIGYCYGILECRGKEDEAECKQFAKSIIEES